MRAQSQNIEGGNASGCQLGEPFDTHAGIDPRRRAACCALSRRLFEAKAKGTQGLFDADTTLSDRHLETLAAEWQRARSC